MNLATQSPPRCNRCILPAHPDLITLDFGGVCNFCNDYKPIQYKGETALINLLDTHRNRDSEYDCIVNISGGRDSAFTLLKLVKDYKMRVLAVNYQNPFVDKQAEENIASMVNILKVRLVQFRLVNHIHERMLKNNVLAWFKRPDPAMVPVICIGCKIIWPQILKIAKENDIGCIINGGNPYEYTTFKKELLGVAQQTGLVSTYILNLFGLVKGAFANLAYVKPQFLPVTVKAFLFANQYSIGSRLLGRNVQRIDLFHYIPWHENEVLSRIQAELSWKYPQELESTWRFDCKLSHLKDVMYLYSLGITEKDDFYAKMVRENKMTRAEALKRITVENKPHPEIIDDIFRQLGIEEINAFRLAH